MNKFIFLCIIIACCTKCNAQEIDGIFLKYKNICIKEREYFEKDNLNGLDSCAKEFRKMQIESSTAFTPLQDDIISLEGHLQFSSIYIDSLIIYKLDKMKIHGDIHITTKGDKDDDSTLYLMHCVIPAGKTFSYRADGNDCQKLLLFAEKTGNYVIDLRHSSTATIIRDQFNMEGWRWITWDMGDPVTEFQFSLTNNECEDVSFAIVTN